MCIKYDLQNYQECPRDHTPNELTKRALENIEKRKGLKKAKTVKELFKKLDL